MAMGNMTDRNPFKYCGKYIPNRRDDGLSQTSWVGDDIELIKAVVVLLGHRVNKNCFLVNVVHHEKMKLQTRMNLGFGTSVNE